MNKDDVQKLATLARIGIPDAEAESLSHEFESILGYIGEIKEAAPASHEATRTPAEFPLRNILRDDTNPHESGIYTEKILNEAPSRQGDYVKVKKIL